VIIGSLVDDWPKQLYARLGFRPTFVERVWDLDRPSNGPPPNPASERPT
jgi:hypothetical protein